MKNMIKKITGRTKKENSVSNKVKHQSGGLLTFIKRPVLAIVVNLVISLVGIVAWQHLSIRELPKLSFPVITVKTEYPGASPGVVESQITIPLEEQFSGLEGLDYVESSTSNGQSVVSLHFRNDKDIDAAAADVRDRVSKAKDSFPHGLRDPVISKSALTERELIRIVAYSDKYNLSEIADQLHRHAKGQIESTPGVASTRIYGASGGGDSGAFQIHAIVSPEKLHAYDLTVKEIRESIQQNSFKKPLDHITVREISFAITLDQAARNIEDYENIVVKHHRSGIVRLKDVANLKMITKDPDSMVRYNGRAGVVMGIVAQQGGNPIETAKHIRTKLESIKKSLPRNLKLDISYDRSETINQSIRSVYKSIFEAILFVFLVILLFLRSWKSTFIPMITIPICIFGGFFVIYLFNFTINILTLLSIVLAIGLVVDDAIVVLENIYRYMEKGMKPLQASIEGIKEIQFAVIAMTLTLMAVYAPITLASGIVGKLFIEFAITLAGTVLISGVVALVLTPMLCSRILVVEHEHSNWQKRARRFLESTDEHYKKWLKYSIDNSKNIFIVCGILAASGLLCAKFYLSNTLMPETDAGEIILKFDTPTGATATYSDMYVRKIENIVRTTPYLRNYVVNLQSRSSDNMIYIKLVDLQKRKKSCAKILKELDKKLELVQSGVHVRSRCTSGTLDGLGGDDDGNSLSFTIQSQKSYDEMEQVARSVHYALLTHKAIDHNSIRASKVSPEKSFEVKINQAKAAQFNVRMLDLGEMLSFVLRGQPPADRFEHEGKRYPMRVMVSDEFKQDPENIKKFHVRATRSASNDKAPPLVSLHELLEIRETTERPLAVRYEGMRSYEFLFNVKKSPTKVYRDITKMLDRILPNGYKYSPTRDLRKTLNEGSNIASIFILALLFIFLIMAAQFESFIDPLMIMFSVPLALAGGVLILVFVPGSSLNIFTYIALITLIGLITKHGILIIDFANKILKTQTLTKQNVINAITSAALLRLRPILMTTSAMILGALPLALSSGSGYEVRSQIGWVIIGGLLIGTFFTVFLIPCVYVRFKLYAIGRMNKAG